MHWILIVPGCPTCGNFMVSMNIERHVFVSSKFANVSAFGKVQVFTHVDINERSLIFLHCRLQPQQFVKLP